MQRRAACRWPSAACAEPGSPREIIRTDARATQLCKECFFAALEDEVHDTVTRCQLFRRGDVVAMGASGGKDSTVLIHILSTLNERHKCAKCPFLCGHGRVYWACPF
jgi:cytoplasmic tRNA 2-thiolation protein 1